MTVSAIRAIRFVTSNVERLAAFYCGLGFNAGAIVAISAEEMLRLELCGAGKRLPLRLGSQCLDLDQFAAGGDAFPPDVDGADSRFQHIAIVTDDAEAAWVRAQSLGATRISSKGPQTLPESSGGVTAIKFRDPEGHPLELLQFPPAHPVWSGHGLLGIDHSALSVTDVQTSMAFYEKWGLEVATRTLNQGPTQAALDGLEGAVVDVIGMQATVLTPHLELLAYRSPKPRRSSNAAVNDIAATRIVWDASEDALLRDPDGHLHHLSRKG